MKFALNGATNIEFGGPRYLHAWVQTSFEDSSAPDVKLIARARQYSCFLVNASLLSCSCTKASEFECVTVFCVH